MVIEEIQVFPLTVPVTNMMIHRDKSGADGPSEEAQLVVSSQREIASLKLRRCLAFVLQVLTFLLFFFPSCWLLFDYVARISPHFDAFFFILTSQRVRQVTRSLLRLGQEEAEMRGHRLVDYRRQLLFKNVATGVHESCPETHGKSMVKSPPSRDNNAGYVASSSGVAEASLFNADFPATASSSTTARGGKSFVTHSHVAEVADGDMEARMDPDLDLDDDPRIAPDESQPNYTVETIAVAAGSLAALFLRFLFGYCCGLKCQKKEEDNMPYTAAIIPGHGIRIL